MADYEYVPGAGDLDESNGRSAVTREHPGGTYHYVLTAEFPFVPRPHRGTPDPSFQRRPAPGGGPGRPGGGQGGGRGAGGGFHLDPRSAEGELRLTDDQRRQVAALKAETKAKLARILTADQMRALEEARPPRGPGGPGGAPGGRQGGTPGAATTEPAR